mmetsp:Transcript_1556/g.4603  ORF Transcript_1556/g.4603 Transcript_1556/m.4603 type:complete len:157 (+) Transcript_1556:81-551(+)|eukprot:CAMPEP_0206144226 /NCGR_PEP_ID=MMETSP1473-20131121/23442_1 /ASSEMBLY_ACC=CAM_ASM_001109 /TAXON_ID=1461547 /ORGANISM="Stichococcus sp, Strain RCC1054" /LENGTH=156 /DNA_ID=CAMNT_0053539983 /DNA_START=49 /DNA_END=519 /DNA_ORIENTATION=+
MLRRAVRRTAQHAHRACLCTVATKPPCPPFTEETAIKKVQAAEDAWNTCDPAKVKMAYSPDSVWRNRDTFLQGRDEIEKFLTAKWKKELSYKLKKELFCFKDNRIAVCFQYEYHNDKGEWFRAYGNENWDFDANGFMTQRQASINDVPIKEAERVL